MTKNKKIKLYISFFYVLFLALFLILLFSKFSVDEIMSYDFIKNNRNYLHELKNKNLFFILFLFLIFSTIWIFMSGFLSPLAILSGFIFGKYLGTIVLVIGTAIGATGIYIMANYFFKDIIRKNFLKKFYYLNNSFKKSEFTYLLLYRFIGGIPFVISNIIPCMFNVKISNFFYATIIGILPQLFIIVYIGHSLENLIEKNDKVPEFKEIIYNSDFYLPMICFFIIVLFSIIFKKVIYKNV